MRGDVTVPAAPFRKILEDRLATLGDHDEPLRRLANDAKINVKAAHRILEHKTASIEFDLADTIVTNTVGPMYWWQDEELTEIYLAADLRRLDWAAPTGDAVRQQQTETAERWLVEYGSIKAASRATGVTKHMLTKRLGREDGSKITSPICARGHDKRVEGTTPSGWCLECRRTNRERKKVAA